MPLETTRPARSATIATGHQSHPATAEDKIPSTGHGGTARRCAGCRFYRELEPPRPNQTHRYPDGTIERFSILGVGQCRVNPPTPANYYNEGGWPRVNHLDWCGVWAERDAAP